MATLPLALLGTLHSWHDFLWVAGFTATVLGLWVLLQLLLEWRKVRRTAGWEVATATVERVSMEQQSGFQGDNATKSWRLTVFYSYESGGEHTGQYRFSKDVRSDAEALVESLPRTEFPVRVDPKNGAHTEVLLRDRPD